jgi:hypothetical protein
VKDKKQNPTRNLPATTCAGGHLCAVVLKASCGGGACTARAEGKLTKVKNDKLRPSSVDLDPGETGGLELKVPLNTRIQAAKALAEGKKVVAKVTVRATDAGGYATTATRTIRIVKGAGT